MWRTLKTLTDTQDTTSFQLLEKVKFNNVTTKYMKMKTADKYNNFYINNFIKDIETSIPIDPTFNVYKKLSEI
jgi:hypothetical protein